MIRTILYLLSVLSALVSVHAVDEKISFKLRQFNIGFYVDVSNLEILRVGEADFKGDIPKHHLTFTHRLDYKISDPESLTLVCIRYCFYCRAHNISSVHLQNLDLPYRKWLKGQCRRSNFHNYRKICFC